MRLAMDEHLKARFSNPQNQDETDLIEQITYKNESNDNLHQGKVFFLNSCFVLKI